MRLRPFLSLSILCALAVFMTVDSTAQGRGNGNKNGAAGWQDNFSQLDLNRWVVVDDYAPGFIPDSHIGFSQPENISVTGGYLVMRLTQQTAPVGSNPDGVISRGAAIYTKDTYGYGTFEWQMRMSSTATTVDGPGNQVSGGVSAGFIYVNNSETEIDIEAAGHAPGQLFLTTWFNRTPETGPDAGDATTFSVPMADVAATVKHYKFVWSRSRVRFYVDNVLAAESRNNVPSAPAHFMINHWGTNSPWFGGTATLDSTRYFYIDSVKYTPQ